MKTNNILLVLLIIVAVAMIILGVNADMKPPILTGVGFIIIAYLFNQIIKK